MRFRLGVSLFRWQEHIEGRVLLLPSAVYILSIVGTVFLPDGSLHNLCELVLGLWLLLLRGVGDY